VKRLSEEDSENESSGKSGGRFKFEYDPPDDDNEKTLVRILSRLGSLEGGSAQGKLNALVTGVSGATLLVAVIRGIIPSPYFIIAWFFYAVLGFGCAFGLHFLDKYERRIPKGPPPKHAL